MISSSRGTAVRTSHSTFCLVRRSDSSLSWRVKNIPWNIPWHKTECETCHSGIKACRIVPPPALPRSHDCGRHGYGFMPRNVPWNVPWNVLEYPPAPLCTTLTLSFGTRAIGEEKVVLCPCDLLSAGVVLEREGGRRVREKAACYVGAAFFCSSFFYVATLVPLFRELNPLLLCPLPSVVGVGRASLRVMFALRSHVQLSVPLAYRSSSLLDCGTCAWGGKQVFLAAAHETNAGVPARRLAGWHRLLPEVT